MVDGCCCGGGHRGLYRYDGKAFTCLTTSDGLVNNDVWSILEDRAGHLWVGTRNSGLCRYDKKRFTVFTEKDTNGILTNFLR
ncbi:two-component regulator propeller domain-containing protein [Larkinella soli]|uniref:two-component regulator propeller domain-containing protein n=1 Tax=Larkinella soli TaxID=1770527 RepID=UPI001E41D2A1|nr:two-component regulator propeller domain-containing protein [Larkinella soli]